MPIILPILSQAQIVMLYNVTSFARFGVGRPQPTSNPVSFLPHNEPGHVQHPLADADQDDAAFGMRLIEPAGDGNLLHMAPVDPRFDIKTSQGIAAMIPPRTAKGIQNSDQPRMCQSLCARSAGPNAGPMNAYAMPGLTPLFAA